MMLIKDKPLPLISCLLVTASGRFHHLQRSVQCYIDQTYPNKELVVLNEGPKEYQEQLDGWFAKLGRSDIRTVWLQGYYTLGALRNISIGMSRGSFCCQWDDDDFCMPQRLSVQYMHLETAGAKICFLTDQLHYYFPNKELYWDNWKRYHSGGHLIYSVIPGTVMFSHDVDVRYPSMGDNAIAGEDSVFLERLIHRHGNSITMLSDVGYIHMYSYHGNNQVYDLQHHISISKNRSQPREDVIKYKNQICQMIDYLKIKDDIRVMCRDGLAFKYQGEHGKIS